MLGNKQKLPRFCNIKRKVFEDTIRDLKTKRVKKLPRHLGKRILSDELVTLRGANTARDYPQALRRVRALGNRRAHPL